MRKALTFLSASLCLAWVATAQAQMAPEAFKDVPTDHWAYQAVEALRAKGILVGYPDGLYRGKRTLTRYEFAVALKRALDSIPTIKGDKGDPGAPGPAGPAGAQGDPGPKGDSGVSPEELAAIKKLADEFKGELSKLGVDVNALSAKLDKMAKDVAALKGDIAKMPKFWGGVFMGVRADRAAGSYVDRNGNLGGKVPTQQDFATGRGPSIYSNSLVNSALMVHDFMLGMNVKAGPDASLTASLITGNYANMLWDNLVQSYGFEYLNTNPQGQTYLFDLALKAPMNWVGRDGTIALGRLPKKLTPFTLWKPDNDIYFDVPWYDDGTYRLDGVDVNTKFGSVGLNLFGGQPRMTCVHGFPLNAPIAGAASPAIFVGPTSGNGWKPTGTVYQGQMMVDQIAGATATLPVNKPVEGGHLRLTALGATGVDAPFSNVMVLGADTALNFSEKLRFDGEFAKTITGVRRFDTTNPYMNQAFNGALGFNTGGLNVTAGYKYIDPLFYAPGYWGRIGNWINPTNIQGATVQAGYNFSPAFGVTFGGDFLTAARNMASSGSLGRDDRINVGKVGVRWDVSKTFQTTVDWEGVYWSLTGFHAGLDEFSGRVHPTEQYLTLGTGVHLTDNTVFKLNYQIGTYDGKILSNGGYLPKYNFNAFTGQVAVKF